MSYLMPRSHENYGQSRQLRARKTWTPVRACGPWDTRTQLNLLRYCGHMHTGGLRCFYVVSTGSLRCFGEEVAITRTVTVRCMYGPVRCTCEHRTDPYVLEDTCTVIVRGPCGSRSWPWVHVRVLDRGYIIGPYSQTLGICAHSKFFWSRHNISMPPLEPHNLRWLQLQLQLEEAEERERAILRTVIWPRQNLNTRRRRWWVRPWIQRRRLFGQYDTLMEELQRESQGDFVSFLGIDPAMFHALLVRVGPRITKVQSEYIKWVIQTCPISILLCTIHMALNT